MEINVNEKNYLNNLNLLKLLALFGVVLGHCTNQYNGNWVLVSTQDSQLFKFISLYVNSFHMQIFVFISGSIYAYCRIKKNITPPI